MSSDFYAAPPPKGQKVQRPRRRPVPPAPASAEPMARQNLRLLAERLKFPPGALEVCIAIEDAHPNWWAFWNEENTRPGFERPPCFSATRVLAAARDVTVYAPDEAGLREAIEQAPAPYW